MARSIVSIVPPIGPPARWSLALLRRLQPPRPGLATNRSRNNVAGWRSRGRVQHGQGPSLCPPLPEIDRVADAPHLLAVRDVLLKAVPLWSTLLPPARRGHGS